MKENQLLQQQAMNFLYILHIHNAYYHKHHESRRTCYKHVIKNILIIFIFYSITTLSLTIALKSFATIRITL
jgi:hypothetical protein